VSVGDIISKLDDIDTYGENLSDWEIDFVDSMLKKTSDPDYAPTLNEVEKIKEIYRDRVL